MLVRSSKSLSKRYILRLGELHAVFAHLRAIGSFICESGIDGTWLDANWFDSLCVVRQVLECKHMKRAVEAHEVVLIVINTLMLQPLIKKFPL